MIDEQIIQRDTGTVPVNGIVRHNLDAAGKVASRFD
jgi:hypothetical protein